MAIREVPLEVTGAPANRYPCRDRSKELI